MRHRAGVIEARLGLCVRPFFFSLNSVRARDWCGLALLLWVRITYKTTITRVVRVHRGLRVVDRIDANVGVTLRRRIFDCCHHFTCVRALVCGRVFRVALTLQTTPSSTGSFVGIPRAFIFILRK